MPSKILDIDGVSRGGDFFKVNPKVIKLLGDDFNPRHIPFNELPVDDLMDFIQFNGSGVLALPPIKVWVNDNVVHLVAGHRRLRATLRCIEERGLPIEFLVAKVVNAKDRAELFAIAYSENQGIAISEEAEEWSFRQFIGFGWSVEQIRKATGKSATHIYKTLKLQDADVAVDAAVSTKKITKTDAITVMKTASKTGQTQAAVLEDFVANKVDRRKTRHSETPEDRCWAKLQPIVMEFDIDLIYTVLKSHEED